MHNARKTPALFACLIAIASTASGGSAQSTDLKTVNVVQYGSGLGSWCIYGAEAGDYFTKAGIKIGNLLTVIGDPNVVSALMSGNSDIGDSGTASLLPVANGQTDQLVVVAGVEGSPVSLIAPNDITSAAQLVGKTVALPGHNTSNEAIGSALTDRYVGKGKWTPLYIGGASTSRLAAVQAGKASAAYINDPADFTDLPGMHTLTHFGADQALYGNGGVITTRNWLKNNPDTAVRWIAAFARGCNYILDPKNRAKAIDVLVKGQPMSVQAATDAYNYYVAGPFRGNTPPKDAKLNVQGFANSVQVLKDEGIISNKDFDYRSVIDESYWQKAIKSPYFTAK